MAQAQQERIPWVPCYNQGVVLCGPGGQTEAANPLFCRSGYATGLGGNYDASRNRLGTELRRTFGLWRDSQHA